MYWLTILTLKAILSSIIGSSFYQWFQGTTGGIWFQKQVDRFMQHFAEKYDIELAKKDAKFRKQMFSLKSLFFTLKPIFSLRKPMCSLKHILFHLENIFFT